MVDTLLLSTDFFPSKTFIEEIIYSVIPPPPQKKIGYTSFKFKSSKVALRITFFTDEPTQLTFIYNSNNLVLWYRNRLQVWQLIAATKMARGFLNDGLT